MSLTSKFLLLKPALGKQSPLSGLEEKKTNPPPTSLVTNLAKGRVSGRRLGRKAGRGKKKGRRAAPSLPPTLPGVVTCTHTFRYAASSAGGVSGTTITIANLVNACGGICTIVNSTVTSWASSIRVNRVTIWPGPSPSAAVTAEVVWQADGSSYEKDTSRIETLPDGVTITRPVTSVPPRGSLARFWQLANLSGNMFTLYYPTGSVVDVSVSFTLCNNQSSLVGWTPATAVLGTVYYARLDGVGGKLTPQGVPTTN